MSAIKTDTIYLGGGQLDTMAAAAISGGSSIPQPYSTGMTYALYNLVEYNGDLWRAKQATTGNVPAVGVNWEKVSEDAKDGDYVVVNGASGPGMHVRQGGVWITLTGKPARLQLTDGQATPATIISLPVNSFSNMNATLVLRRGTGSQRLRRSEFRILTDGTNIEQSETFSSLGIDVNITVSIAVTSGNLLIQYVSGLESNPDIYAEIAVDGHN